MVMLRDDVVQAVREETLQIYALIRNLEQLKTIRAASAATVPPSA